MFERLRPFAAALAPLALAAPALAGEPLAAPGPQGALSGTLIRPAEERPVVLIVPGSGPTDRDGNNPMGVAAAPYRMLAEALGERGIGSVRIDKRGMFASAGAAADPNAVTIGDYGDDLAAWIGAARQATGRPCIWVLGHSEGGLVALASAARLADACGFVLVAASGQTYGDLIRTQLGANPANAPILPDALDAIDRLERGERVDVSAMHPALQSLFNPAVQGFLIDAMAHDPLELAAQGSRPVLVVQGGRDLQVPTANGEALHAARPGSSYVLLPHMNHVLKDVADDDPGANMAAYADPHLPLSPGLADAIARFVTAPDGQATDTGESK